MERGNDFRHQGGVDASPVVPVIGVSERRIKAFKAKDFDALRVAMVARDTLKLASERAEEIVGIRVGADSDGLEVRRGLDDATNRSLLVESRSVGEEREIRVSPLSRLQQRPESPYGIRPLLQLRCPPNHVISINPIELPSPVEAITPASLLMYMANRSSSRTDQNDAAKAALFHVRHVCASLSRSNGPAYNFVAQSLAEPEFGVRSWGPTLEPRSCV